MSCHCPPVRLRPTAFPLVLGICILAASVLSGHQTQADISQIEGDAELIQRLLHEGPRTWKQLIKDLQVQTGR